MVPRAAAHRPLRGPGAVGGAGRLGVDGGPVAARAAQPARARGLRAAGGVRVRLPARSRRRWGGRRRRAASSRCGRGATWTRAGLGSRPTAGSARNWPARFFDAFSEGDVDGLRELLAADVQMVGDGGGKAPQLARAVIGAENVARVLAAIVPPVGPDRRASWSRTR